MSEVKKTLVEEGTELRGSLVSSCPIEVKGKVDGELTAPSLTVSSSGAVHGKVRVGELRSQGEIAGEFDADMVQLSGSVKDNTVIRAKTLEVKLTPKEGKLQVIFGECSIEVGDTQAKSASIEPPKEEATANAGSTSNNNNGKNKGKKQKGEPEVQNAGSEALTAEEVAVIG